MRTLSLSLLPVVASVIALATGCSAAPLDGAEQSEEAITRSWFSANAPRGSAEEKAILALVNDKSMSPYEYVEKCDFSLAASASIVDYRQGDEPASASDDRVFGALSTLDRLPFTDQPFWAAALACAKEHYLPGGGTGGTCATGTSTVQQSPLAIQLVLDGSASMTGKKWDAATAAVREIFAGQAAKNDAQVGMGFIGFSDSKDPTGNLGPYPTSADVPVAAFDAAHLARLTGRLDGARAAGATPLYEAVTGAYGYLAGFQPTGALASASKVVVLLTDGLPNNRASELLTFVSGHVDEAQLFALGIGEVGAGGGYDPAYVGQLAVAGGTRASATCNPTEGTDASKMCHFQVTPGAKPAATIKDELLAAVGKVRANVAACDIGLQTLGTGALDPSKVTVTVKNGDGTEVVIRKHKTYGWSFDDAAAPTKVLLRGKACNELRSDAQAVARVEIGCK